MRLRTYSKTEFESILKPSDDKKVYIQNVRMNEYDLKMMTVEKTASPHADVFQVIINAMIQPELEMYLKQMLNADKRLSMHSSCHAFIAFKAMSACYNRFLRKESSYFNAHNKIIKLPHAVDQKMMNCFKNTNPHSEVMQGYESGHPANELDEKRIKSYPYRLINFVNEKTEFHEADIQAVYSQIDDYITKKEDFSILGLECDEVVYFISSSLSEDDDTFSSYFIKTSDVQNSALSFAWFLLNANTLIESIIYLAHQVDVSSKKDEAMSVYALESIIEYYTHVIEQQMSGVLRDSLIETLMLDEYINVLNFTYNEKNIHQSIITQLSLKREFDEAKYLLKNKNAEFLRFHIKETNQWFH